MCEGEIYLVGSVTENIVYPLIDSEMFFFVSEHLQDAIETGCKKCTEAQEKGAYRVIEHLIKNELDIWRELAAKYDKDGSWRKKYEDRARANGIQIPE